VDSAQFDKKVASAKLSKEMDQNVFVGNSLKPFDFEHWRSPI